MNLNQDYVITQTCNYCKQKIKHLIKEISESRFKELTKSEFITWCEVCCSGSFITKDKYKKLESTKEVTNKAGGILWKAMQHLNG